MTNTLTMPDTTQAVRLKYVLDGTFRANPDYQLIPFDQLPADQRELFAALKENPDHFGVLWPRGNSRLPLKSACRDTARLFLALENPSGLPSFATSGPRDDANEGIARLVLDGVLEFAHNGVMVHGSGAFEAVCVDSAHQAAHQGIAQLSREALIYAQSLPFTEASLISGRLYNYGRVPVTGSWRRRFPNADSVRRCLHVEENGKNALRLAGRWNHLPPDKENSGWLYWHTRSETGTEPIAAYKLYLSPRPAYVAEVFEAALPALEACRANAFKVGRDLSGILRADKMVAYFSRFDQVEEAAGRILEKLPDCPAQGVPFTSELGSPLVSWGSDPPAERGVPPWLARQSWRLWITNRLAVALLGAKHQADVTSREPWQFALDRLRLEGVDTKSWSPLKRKEN